MKPKPIILCVDDQREVLAALQRDLRSLDEYCALQACESAQEALTLIEECLAYGEAIALVISDHVMPELSGVDFLAQLAADIRLRSIRRMLITGLANQEDTIRAINAARIHAYIAKPWSASTLITQVSKQLGEWALLEYPEYATQFAALIEPQQLFEQARLHSGE